MGMRPATVRFSEDLWEMLEREAEAQGISTAQLLREAAIMRVAALATHRGDPRFHVPVEDLAERQRKPKTQRRGDVRDPARLAALKATGLLDNGNSSGFDRLVEAASRALNCPVSLLTLIEADKQIFKSQRGLPEPWASRGESPLAYSFCAEAAVCRDPLVVNDARSDPQWRDNPAIEEMGVVAYLGVPIITPAGHALGTLCVIDQEPRNWTGEDIALMKALGETAVSLIDATAAASG